MNKNYTNLIKFFFFNNNTNTFLSLFIFNDNKQIIMQWQLIIFLFLFVFIIFIYFEGNREIFYSLGCMILIYFFYFPFFIILKMDFIGTAILLIYVGAVSVLFLFVLMTVNTRKINIHFLLLNNNIKFKSLLINNKTKNITFFTFFVLFLNLFLSLLTDLNVIDYKSLNNNFTTLSFKIHYYYNIQMLGITLYKFYYMELYIFGLVLLTSILGSILFFKK